MVATAATQPKFSELEAYVRLANGELYSVNTDHVTPRSIVIACCASELEVIKPRQIDNGAKFENLNVELYIPLNHRPAVKLESECRVSSVRRIAQDVFHIELVFTDLAPHSFRYLAEYMAEHSA